MQPFVKHTPLILALIILSRGCCARAGAHQQQPTPDATTRVNFEPADKSFSASFPRQPTDHIQRVFTMHGMYIQHSYTAAGGGAVIYNIIVQELPAVAHATPSQMLDVHVKLLLKGLGQSLEPSQLTLKYERQRDLALGDYPGRQYSIVFGEKTGVLRFYLVGLRLYMLLALGGTEGDAQVSRFLTSFTLHVTVPPDTSAVATGATTGRSSTTTPAASPSPERLKDVLSDTLKSRPTEKQTGAGIGTGEGSGAARVVDGGVGAGRNTGGGSDKAGNPEGAFKGSEVTIKAVIIARPEPTFTEEARRNEVEGVVRLRVVLSSTGRVTNISVTKGLPNGLTEHAIAAAREIKFTPAQKDGRAVSQYISLEYNFYIVYKEDEVSDKAVILEHPAPRIHRGSAPE